MFVSYRQAQPRSDLLGFVLPIERSAFGRMKTYLQQRPLNIQTAIFVYLNVHPKPTALGKLIVLATPKEWPSGENIQLRNAVTQSVTVDA